MAYVNKKRDSGEYVQLSLQITPDFKTKLKQASQAHNQTITQYVIAALERVLNGEDIKFVKKEDLDYEKLDSKLDTIINLISKL